MGPMERFIDLRSDTVTRPGPEMRAAMAAAEVGDDVYAEDPTVNLLEERVATLLGKEAALFCPSGTMANLISVASATHPGEEVLLDGEAHILHYELAGSSLIAGVQLRNFDAPEAGCPTPQQLNGLRRLDDPAHEPRQSLLCLEQTHNRRGGTVAAITSWDATCATAHQMGLRVHLDGARLGNAATHLGVPPARVAAGADSVMLSLSKGLGCPVGSVWAGTAAQRPRAHVWRKRVGGGMRQAGILAAAGLWALEHQLPRLGEDQEKAKLLATRLADVRGLTVDPAAVQTNIVLLATSLGAEEVVRRAAASAVLLSAFGPHTVRAVTHLDVSDQDVITAAERIAASLGA